MMIHTKPGPKDALLIVDVQNDFCSGGKLAVPHADEIIPPLNQWAERAEQGGAIIVASRDFHPADHISFHAKGGPWPQHCLQHSKGAELHPQLKVGPSWQILNKGTRAEKDNYSAFDDTGLADRLRAAGIERLWIGGLALDVCVRATVLDALAAGFQVNVLKDATRAVHPEAEEQVFRELESQGARCVALD
jgi:nicotinamidase/pyrazinamidase